MSSQVYTFKLNADKIRGIFDKKRYTISLRDYIENTVNKKRENYNNKYKTDYHKTLDTDKVIENLQDVDNLASCEDIGILFDWLWDIKAFIFDGEEDYAISFSNYGFELIDDFDGKDKCWVYLNQMAQYGDMIESTVETDSYDGSYYLLNGGFYKRYLKYVIALLSQLSLEYEKPYLSAVEIDKLQINLMDEEINKLIERPLAKIRADNEVAIAHEARDSNYRRSVDEIHCVIAYHMLLLIEGLQQSVASYDGKVFIHHSY